MNAAEIAIEVARRQFAQEFAELARARKGQEFEAWLTRATASGVTELRGFALGLREDRAAVEAGLSLEWSNGQTEGQVNKLKLLKLACTGGRTSTCCGSAYCGQRE